MDWNGLEWIGMDWNGLNWKVWLSEWVTWLSEKVTTREAIASKKLNEIYFSLRGICYSSDECAGITGSYADGKCAQGFGVCCVIRWSARWSEIFVIIFLFFRVSGCGGDVSQNSTHIQNTGYPSAFKTATSCSYTFKKMNLDICFFRLEFVNFILTGTQSASAHECSVDYVRTVTNYWG